jgi:Glycosyltransferase family 87
MSDSDSGIRSSSRFTVLALILALAGAGSMLYYHLGLFIPRVLDLRTAQGLGNGYSFGDDFYPIWLVTRQWGAEHRDPYSSEMTRQIQVGLFGRALDPRNPTDPSVDYRQFAYPAFAELLLWPAASLEFPKLRVLLAVLLPVLTVVSLWLWMLALNWHLDPLWFAVLASLALCNYEVLEALFAEQPGLIAGFLLAGASLALRRDRLLLAGALLALTLIKPQMTALAAAYLLLWSFSDRRRAPLWAGFLSTTLLLAVASLWIWPRWLGQWLNVLLGYHRYATPPLVTLLPGPQLGPYVGPAAILVLLGVSAALAWKRRKASPESVDFWITLSLLLAITSVSLLPGQAIYDHVILLPGIFLLARYRRELHSAGRISRVLLAVGTVIVLWPLASAFGVIALRWLAPGLLESNAIFSLPIRTAASLPFAVLALLVCAARINLSENPEVA